MEQERKQDIFDKGNLMRLSGLLKDAWRQAPDTEPDFLEVYSAAAQEEKEKEISRAVEKGKAGLGEYPQSFFAVRKRKEWKKRMEQLLGQFLREDALLNTKDAMDGEELGEFQDGIKEFLREVRKFDRKLALEDMGQALRNYVVYAVFRVLNGRKPQCRPAAFGYSMLYPYTDNYIDSPERTRQEKEHYNRLIADWLKGKAVKPLSGHERKTVELLWQVETDYGRPHEVYKGLLLMLEAQENSLRQEQEWKREEGTGQEEEILGVSVYKGGVSVMMDRYFVDLPWTERDLYFYYGFGFLLQLCDDLQDIALDKEEGNPTVFSLCRSKEEAVGKVNKLLHFTEKLFAFCDTGKPAFQAFLQRNCFLLILASAVGSGEWMTDEWLDRMERRLPVRPGYLRDFGTGFLGGKSRGKTDAQTGGMTGGKKEEPKKRETQNEKRKKKEHRKMMRMLDVMIAD